MAKGHLAHQAARPTRPRVTPPPLRGVTPAPAPSRPTIPPPGGGGGGGDGTSPLDYSSDPILLRAKALRDQNVASAQGAELASRQAALIQYGFDPGFGTLYGDEGTAGSAKANTFSVLANLARDHESRAAAVDRNLGGNLFYSTSRGQAITNEGQQYLGAQSDAAGRLRDLLSGYSDKLAGVKSAENDRVYGAEGDAYQRALEWALAHPGATPGGAPRTVTPAPAGRQIRPTAPAPRQVRPVSRLRPAGRQP